MKPTSMEEFGWAFEELAYTITKIRLAQICDDGAHAEYLDEALKHVNALASHLCGIHEVTLRQAREAVQS
jgi:hypothetical protein